jgi:hypothetical protein
MRNDSAPLFGGTIGYPPGGTLYRLLHAAATDSEEKAGCGTRLPISAQGHR